MKLINFWYRCDNCGTTINSPELPENTYGDFLLRNQTGDIAYLDAICCNEFKEVLAFLKEKTELDVDARKRADVIHKIFGLICDQSDTTNYYSIDQNPKCPNCGQSKYKHWGPTNPPETVDVNVKTLTFHKWNSLRNEQKKDQVDELLKLFLSSKKECA